MLVGSGEKVLVSVASVAVNRRMSFSFLPSEGGEVSASYADGGVESLNETP